MIKFIIAQGIGFSPGSVKWIPTLGFSIGSAIVIALPDGRTVIVEPESRIFAVVSESRIFLVDPEDV